MNLSFLNIKANLTRFGFPDLQAERGSQIDESTKRTFPSLATVAVTINLQSEDFFCMIKKSVIFRIVRTASAQCRFG